MIRLPDSLARVLRGRAAPWLLFGAGLLILAIPAFVTYPGSLWVMAVAGALLMAGPVWEWSRFRADDKSFDRQSKQPLFSLIMSGGVVLALSLASLAGC